MSEPLKTVVVRLPSALLAQVQSIAAAEERTVSQVVRRLLAEAAGGKTSTLCFATSAEVPTPLPHRSHTRGKPARQAGDADFAAFWSAYPRRIAKAAARKAWAKLIANGITPAAIMAKLKAYTFPPEEQYQPHPASWLNREDFAAEETPPILAAIEAEPEGPLWQELRGHISASDYRAWFSQATLKGDMLHAGSSFKASYIRANYLRIVLDVFGNVGIEA